MTELEKFLYMGIPSFVIACSFIIGMIRLAERAQQVHKEHTSITRILSLSAIGCLLMLICAVFSIQFYPENPAISKALLAIGVFGSPALCAMRFIWVNRKKLRQTL